MKLGNVGVDCNDVEVMAEFWAGALDYRIAHRSDTEAQLKDKRELGPRIYLQKVPEPRTGKNRLHIDLYVLDEEAEAARIEALGARRVKRFDRDEGDIWIVMTDPEGNEFCVCKAMPENMADGQWGPVKA
ncbi:MAG TPA: VOC family protein [Actinomycetota bacterium]|nr:VOC family protein [Actinomycetota bacterium]